MKAHYNANNEIMYGVWMMDNAWLYENEMMQDEIYSEQGLTAEDAALAIFFSKNEMAGLSITLVLIDSANCYDSIAFLISKLSTYQWRL